jgi:hypothetical protein
VSDDRDRAQRPSYREYAFLGGGGGGGGERGKGGEEGCMKYEVGTRAST